MANLPYAQAISTVETMLEKIKTASVPEKFSQDFVSTKLMMKGGNGRAAIPFIKKMGLVSDDGTPTERYKEFRNSTKSGKAIADAIGEMYNELFEMNEYVHELGVNELKALVVEATGAEPSSTPVRKVVTTFQALCKLADFGVVGDVSENAEPEVHKNPSSQVSQPLYQHTHEPNGNKSESINLSYTINLNLPATTDIEVFNAIFKSLKQHLMQE